MQYEPRSANYTSYAFTHIHTIMSGNYTMQDPVPWVYLYRILLALILLLIIGVYFWSQSRYPNLNDKALMGGAIQLQDSLSFEARYPVDPAWPVWKRIGYTTLNWIWTNRRGMIFGVLFGAAFLTFLRYLPRRSFNNSFLNALTGFFMGAPLGVCVNCASPVAAGLYAGGMRVETTLAAMIASPTFNVIVLSILFSLMPFYLAAIKIALTLMIILIAIPLLCRFLPAEELQLAQSSVSSCIINPLASETHHREPFIHSVPGFILDFLRDLWFIVKMTVPLMFVAGFLGSVFATVVPFDLVADLPVNLFTLTIAAIVGVIAPVPMAFDVIFAAVLLAGGLPVGFVMVMLFTLGIFSIYSFFIVSQSISVRAASLVTAVIVVIGIASGYVADAYHNRQAMRALEILGGGHGFSLISSVHAEELSTTARRSSVEQHIAVTNTKFGPRSPAGEKPFTRMEAWHIGIDRPNTFSMTNMFTPHNFTAGSTSAADIDNDGDQDVVLALVNGGIRIFLNDGSGHFAPAREKLDMFENIYVFNAIPADVNNDGLPDLFVTTFLKGNHVVWNRNGRFSEDNMTEVKNREDAFLVLTAAFADIDQDGFLDVVIGNHQGSRMNKVPNERDRNRIIFNDNGKLTGDKFVETDGPPGDTLSILLSDFNQDGRLDLIEANDFNQPDLFR